MMQESLKFHIEPTNGCIISSMRCEIYENSCQSLDFYYYTPVFDDWERGFYGSCYAHRLHKSKWSPETGISDYYCGFFPENPSTWCTSVYGYSCIREHEYSKFLHPPEFKEKVEEIREKMW